MGKVATLIVVLAFIAGVVGAVLASNRHGGRYPPR